MTKEEDTIAELQSTIEKNQGEYEGKLAAMQEQLDTATSHSVEVSKKLKKYEDAEIEKRKAIRKDNEAKAHAIKKDLDVKDWSDDRLEGFLEGNQSVATSHSTQAPPAGDPGTSSQVPKTAGERLSQM